MSKMSDNCFLYKEKLKDLNRSLEFEYKIGAGNRYNDLMYQAKYIETLQLRIENIQLLIEKHCNN